MEIQRETCFVIQPFDNGIFDSRYSDVYKPAIEKAGLKPYRVDYDLSVRVAIEEIEKQIKLASICFADITLDNPNVWYELGYAFACGKDVVMVCSNERITQFPFDIRHKTIIKYSTGAPSYFIALEYSITEKLKALRASPADNCSIGANIAPSFCTLPLLNDFEVLLLKFVLEGQPTHEDHARLYEVNLCFLKLGYTDYRFSLSLRGLVKKGFIKTSKEFSDWNNYEYTACRVTESGEEWIFNNVDNDPRLMDFNHLATVESDLPF